MKITKGTPQAMKLLEELKKSGDLVDVYSADFFNRQPTYEEDPLAPFEKGAMDAIEEVESDPDENAKPKNHLLFIFVDEYKKDTLEKLKAVYPPLQKIFKQGHLPDFLLLNLYSKQMLCIGFGRKNRMFILDAETGKGINAFDLCGIGDDSAYMNKFTEHDYYDATSDFLHALSDLSIAMYEYDNLPGNVETVEWALNENNIRDGLHYIEDEDDGYTTEQINEFIEKYREYQQYEDEAMKMIKVFFPQCERGELNTGDYPF
jgi:hypothetical protein